jgi:hypothetical protein
MQSHDGTILFMLFVLFCAGFCLLPHFFVLAGMGFVLWLAWVINRQPPPNQPLVGA